MSERGVFAVDRGIFDQTMFESKEPFSKREAWVASQGLQQVFDDCVDQRIADAGFTMEPAVTEGFWTMHHRGEPIVNKDYERHVNAARAVKDLVEKELPQTSE